MAMAMVTRPLVEVVDKTVYATPDFETFQSLLKHADRIATSAAGAGDNKYHQHSSSLDGPSRLASAMSVELKD